MALYRESLSERGVLSLHLGLALIESDKERIASTLSALRATFAHVEVYWSIVPSYGGMWLMAVASQQPLVWEGHGERLEALGSLQWLSPAMLSAGRALPPVVQTLLVPQNNA